MEGHHANYMYRRCRRLVVYGSVTLIGSDSWYSAEEPEQIAGPVVRREHEADWDW